MGHQCFPRLLCSICDWYQHELSKLTTLWIAFMDQLLLMPTFSHICHPLDYWFLHFLALNYHNGWSPGILHSISIFFIYRFYESLHSGISKFQYACSSWHLSAREVLKLTYYTLFHIAKHSSIPRIWLILERHCSNANLLTYSNVGILTCRIVIAFKEYQYELLIFVLFQALCKFSNIKLKT